MHHNKKIEDYENINSVHPLYLVYIIGIYWSKQWKQVFSYLVSTDGHKKVLATFTKLWNEIKYLIETINEGKKAEYEKDFMKIKFNSDDNLPLGCFCY